MTGSEPSWQLKIRRAEKHLSDLSDLIDIPQGRQRYPTREILDPGGEYDYAIDLAQEISENVPIVAGDLLFNVRSALDHITCALIPGEDKGRSQFPIFTDDPMEVGRATGKYRDPTAANVWRRCVRGVPSNAVAVITRSQPYYQARLKGEDATHHTLAVLNSLQNADKHRKLIFSRPALKHVAVLMDGVEVDWAAPAVYDGTVVVHSPTQVDVEVKGTAVVPFGIGGQWGYEYPLMFEMILDFVRDQVLPTLEALIP
jgi:hypothetical protein